MCFGCSEGAWAGQGKMKEGKYREGRIGRVEGRKA